MNPRNTVTIVGRIPATDKIRFEYINKTGEENKGVFMGSVSVRRSFKRKDDQYYPEDLINFKAFGKAADFIKNYIHRGDQVAISGELRRDDNYTNDEGKVVYGQLYLHVDVGGLTSIGNGSKNADTEASSVPEINAAAESGPRSLIRNRRFHRHAVI